MNALELLVRRLTAAYRTLPGGRDWLCAGGLLLAYSLFALCIGYGTGFLQPGGALSWPLAGRVVLTALLLPAIVEETLFRVLLLPHPSEKAPTGVILLWAFISLTLFIASHPLNAFFFAPSERPTSTNSVFLFLAAPLGLVCTLAYLKSGSLWPPVAIHWIVVIVWLLYLGGYQRLNARWPWCRQHYARVGSVVHFTALAPMVRQLSPVRNTSTIPVLAAVVAPGVAPGCRSSASTLQQAVALPAHVSPAVRDTPSLRSGSPGSS